MAERWISTRKICCLEHVPSVLQCRKNVTTEQRKTNKNVGQSGGDYMSVGMFNQKKKKKEERNSKETIETNIRNSKSDRRISFTKIDLKLNFRDPIQKR